MRHAILLPVLAIGLCAASPALAAGEAVSVPVSVADLDLSDPADAARLRTRLGRAATAACAEPGDAGVGARVAFKTCRDAALKAASLKAERAIAAANIGDTRVRTARR